MKKFLKYRFLFYFFFLTFYLYPTYAKDDFENNLEEIEKRIQKYKNDNLNLDDKLILIKDVVNVINNTTLNLNEYEKVTLFLGQTKVGKSLLIHYLSGSTIKGTKVNFKSSLEYTPIFGLEHIKVGNGVGSCTTIPRSIFHSELGALLDCPGFGDLRGIIYQIINAKLIHEVSNKSRELKIVLCISEENIVDELIKSSDDLKGYICEENFPSVLVIINKGDKERNTIEDRVFFKKTIENILIDKGLSLSQYQINFLGFIMYHEKFEFSFKKGTQVGEIVSGLERDKIITSLRNHNLKSMLSKSLRKSIDISGDAKNIVNEFHHEINNYIQKNVQYFCESITKYYDNKINQINIKEIDEDFVYEYQPILSKFCQSLEVICNNNTENTIYFHNQLKDLVETSMVEPNLHLKGILSEIEQNLIVLSSFEDMNKKLKETRNLEDWILELIIFNNNLKKAEGPLIFFKNKKNELDRKRNINSFKRTGGEIAGGVGMLAGMAVGGFVGGLLALPSANPGIIASGVAGGIIGGGAGVGAVGYKVGGAIGEGIGKWKC